MAENTKIQWADHSASPWHGCQHATMPDGSEHPGCANCYAERQSKRNQRILGEWGAYGTRVKSKSFIANLIAWNKVGEKRGRPVSVFPSICDPFEEQRGLIPWREEMFRTIDRCPWVRLLLATKRPQNVRRMWPQMDGTRVQDFDRADYRNNVWILTSVSDQQTADAMVPRLLECRDLCPVLGLSIEPLLGPVDLSSIATRQPNGDKGHPLTKILESGQINWVIVGGESGPGSRPCHVDWIRSIVWNCKATEVPCFVKQLGAHPIEPNGTGFIRHMMMRDKKGGDTTEWPEDLRVRQFPEVPQ